MADKVKSLSIKTMSSEDHFSQHKPYKTHFLHTWVRHSQKCKCTAHCCCICHRSCNDTLQHRRHRSGQMHNLKCMTLTILKKAFLKIILSFIGLQKRPRETQRTTVFLLHILASVYTPEETHTTNLTNKKHNGQQNLEKTYPFDTILQ